LASLTGASENSVRRWLKEFEDEEECKIKTIRLNEFGVTPAGIKAHESAITALEAEFNSLRDELGKDRDDAAGHKHVLSSFLAVQKRLSELTGVEGMIAGHKALTLERAKMTAREVEPQDGKKPPLRSGLGFTPSGAPVVPLD